MSSIYKAYREHGAALKRFLWRYYKRAEDVEDAAQEAFLRAFAAEARKEIRAPKEFLFQTAKHYALNDIEKKTNSSTDYLADFEAGPVLQDEAQLGADEELAGRQKLAMFAEAVAELPPQCRRVFMLRKFDGLKVKDIAKRLDITVSAVEKHIATGVIKCADYLEERGYEVGGAKRSNKSGRGPADGNVKILAYRGDD